MHSRPASTPKAPPRKLNLLVLTVLVLACVGFALFDLFHVHIWWSTALIYTPCAALFSLGLFGWMTRSSRVLRSFSLTMAVVDAALIVYSAILSEQRSVWGPVTLVFAAFTCALTWSAWEGSRSYVPPCS